MAMRKKASTKIVASRIMDSIVWEDGSRVFSYDEINVFRSVTEYDGRYLEESGYEDSTQKKEFLDMVKQSGMFVHVVEKPFEIVYDEELTRVLVPEFLVFTHVGRGVIVMLMPYRKFGCGDTLMKIAALRRFCKENGFGWVVFDMERKISFKWVMLMTGTDSSFLGKIIDALHCQKWLRGYEIYSLQKEHKVSPLRFQNVVLNNGLLYIGRTEKRKVSLLTLADSKFMESYSLTSMVMHYDRV